MRRALPLLVVLALVAGCVGPRDATQAVPRRVVLDPAVPFDDRLPPVPEKVEHAPADWPFDVRHYSIRVALDFERARLDGSVTITVGTLEDGLTELPLDAVDLAIRGVRDARGRSAPHRVDPGRLVIDLGGRSRKGEERAFTITYSGSPQRGLYFNRPSAGRPDAPLQAFTQGECEDTRYWLPCHDFPDDRATHDIAVTVPRGMHVSAAGERRGVEEVPGGRSTWSFGMDVPHVAYLITLVAGEYEVLEEQGVVPLEYIVEKRDAAHARHSFRKTDQILRFLGDYTGQRYPYARYAQCCVREFMFGGMENISATTLTDRTVHPPQWEPMRTSHGLVAHEAAHQWFGDLITCKDWAHVWLNEGFATYMTLLWREHDDGRDAFLAGVRGTMNGATRASEKARRPVVSYTYAEPFDLFFDGHAYGGGAARLHMLRVLLGDERFRRVVRDYVARHARSVATTEDFERAATESAGEDLSWFFDQWFRTPGRPKLKVRWKWQTDEQSMLVTVEQTQNEPRFPKAYRLPLDMAFDLRNGRTESVRLDVRKRKETFPVRLPAEPRMVRVDPQRGLLARLDLGRGREQWLRLVELDPSPAGRLDAVAALGRASRNGKLAKAERARALAAVARATAEDPVRQVRMAALKELARTRTDATMERLAERYAADPDPRIRVAVVGSLGEFVGNGRAIDLLREATRSHLELVRAPALRGLAKQNAGGAFALLVAALGEPGWQSRLRAAALDGLAELGDERAYPLLVQYAARDADPATRSNALAALGRMGRMRPEYTDAVLAHLHDPSRNVRRAAIAALGKLEDTAALPALVAAYAAEPWKRNQDAIRGAVKAIRKAAVLAGEHPTLETRRAAGLRLEHDAVRRQLGAAAPPDRKPLREQLAALRKELDALGVPPIPPPPKPKGKPKPGKGKRKAGKAPPRARGER